KVKELMVRNEFAKSVNPAIKQAKELSDITFNVPANHQPYKEKLILRHHDIYVSGNHINALHFPIENGDVFEIYEGNKLGFYILVAQDCDLMMRTNRGGRMGVRAARTAILLKLDILSLVQLDKKIEEHREKSEM